MDTERIGKLAEWHGKSLKFLGANGIWLQYEDGYDYPWNPLERIQDAWMLVEKARMEYKFYLVDGMFGDGWQCAFYQGSVSSAITGQTAPLAICAAIEKLMEEKGDKP